MARKLVAAYPQRPRYQNTLASCYGRQADLLRIRKLDKALSLQQQGISILEKLNRDFPDDHGYRLGLLGFYKELATTWRLLERREKEEQAIRRVTELSGELVDDAQDSLAYLHDLTLFLREHAASLRANDRREGRQWR